ncbi:hypothetical protein F511_22439 [Dorcoceras hygrometricum]|uniref:SMP-LTD domain-containing protein n=1 Tax=Dorcoceras hygrometricum TaxID=472368 RepID=A0A2Z7AZT6_9LAMI|nr:hypothetical protein F511_22439 [Dorcoceras hygrometricum]
MVLQSASSASPLNSCDFSRKSFVLPSISQSHRKRRRRVVLFKNVRRVLLQAQACINGGNAQHHQLGAATRTGANNIVLKRFSDGRDLDYASLSRFDGRSNYYNSTFGQDPIVDKLRSQLGVIHAIPSPTQINSSIFGLFAFFFFVGVGFDKMWTSSKKNTGSKQENRPQVPTTLSMILEKDLQRKESVEWVNMVLGKLWKVYRSGIENWIIGLLQPVIDNLIKPDYVRRVEVKQFSMGDEPLSVRSVERRTSRRDNDLQYLIGVRYTGGARMLLRVSLKFGLIPIVVPIRVRDFDIDGELWVKLRLIPTEPWVGAVSWAFASLPRIKFELSPFRLFNLMGTPVPFCWFTLS